jgi:hypothetical protein
VESGTSCNARFNLLGLDRFLNLLAIWGKGKGVGGVLGGGVGTYGERRVLIQYSTIYLIFTMKS